MAKQEISLGVEGSGQGGDTNRSAFVKINAMNVELYNALGATNNVLPAAGLPIAKGGTGAITVAKARENLGLNTVELDVEAARLKIPDLSIGLFVQKNKRWGAWDYGTGKTIPLAVTDGGTGGTSASEARENLGLKTENTTNTARYKSPDGTKWIFIQNDGQWGAFDSSNSTYIPANQSPINKYDTSAVTLNFNSLVKGGLHVFNGTPIAGITNAPPVRTADTQLHGALEVLEASGRIIQRWHNSNGSAVAFYFRFYWGSWTAWYKVYHEANTTVDGNGFIKSASPICNLYADKITLNDEAKQQEISFKKIGVGEYIISGSTGFAQEGWYIETPNDANGNILFSVEYEQLENNDLIIKTYKKIFDIEQAKVISDLNNPVDITEGRYITLRLHEAYQVSEVPPIDDNPPLDSTGNPAPSKYHVLKDGQWIISDADLAKLSQEKLEAMQPLTRRQFRLALVTNGYDLDYIENLILKIPDETQRKIVWIEWNDANTFERTNTSLLLMAQLMELTEDQVNLLWNQALTFV